MLNYSKSCTVKNILTMTENIFDKQIGILSSFE